MTNHQRSDRQERIDAYKSVRTELVRCKNVIGGMSGLVADDIHIAINAVERELSRLLLDREINP